MNTQRWMIALAALNATVLTLVLLLAGRSAVSATDDVPTVLRAQRIELVDTTGRPRARLNTESNGEVVLRLLGANGEVRVKLGASDDGSGLVLANQTTQPGVHILATRDSTSVKLAGSGGRQRIIEP